MTLAFDYYLIKKDMLETYSIQELFLRGMPIPYLIQLTNKHRDDIEKGLAGVIEKRAKHSLSKIDLTHFQNELQSVKRLITALHLIRNELYRRTQYATGDLQMLISFEKMDNIVKKARLNPGVEWVQDEFEEVTIIEETGGYLSVNEIYTIENADEKSMLEYANTLLAKLLVRPDMKDVDTTPTDVIDKAYHRAECAKLNLNPSTTTAKELADMLDLLAEDLAHILEEEK